MPPKIPAKRSRAPDDKKIKESTHGEEDNMYSDGSGEETKTDKPIGASAAPLPVSTPLQTPRSTPNLSASSPISVKRQRLSSAKAAMTTLARPFRSPLMVRRGDASSTPAGPGTGTVTNTSMKPPTSQKFRITRTPRTQYPIPSDPEIAELNAQLTTLRSRLKTAQTYLSMSQQALLLESLPPAHKDSDEHLEELISKWRGAARQAADYLFGVAGDRVNRMGGARAYFERERDRKNKWEGGEADSGVNSGWADAEDGANVDPEVIEERKRQLIAEYDLEEPSPSSKSRKEVDIAQTDDDHFTMEMMLKTMNIDFRLIGFCPDRQCWATD
ncbi:hypothetical protein L211DRAFT_104417 [Terfezia boudieri ATCC MYA-4762]|uniref:Swi5-domain-containing protein n=1 Tax=Terfezia boudieri ATCC MYA-4762 TaxID=1051890 RepID=A0A3N4LQV5_9PEZI|nr:hypothetical protein L211DRAFT_104417 [Terfezia boudieri ATCC MYA-4762]